MRFPAAAVLAACVLTIGARGQAPPQTIDLPSIDRTQIAFRLDAAPAVIIGPAQVPGASYRSPNRVARLSDGRLMMASLWGFSRLHLVEPPGNARAVGDFGSRVGSLHSVCLTTGDRLLVFHDSTKFTWFTSAGVVESSGTKPSQAILLCPVDGPHVWVRVPVPRPGLPPSRDKPPDPSLASVRTKAAVRRISLGADSQVVADLGEFEARDFYSFGPFPATQGNRPIYSRRTRPFTRDLATATDGSRLHAGDGTTWEIRTWDATGRLVRTLRVGGPLDPVTPELRSAFIEEEFAGNTAAYRERTIGFQRLADTATYPSHLPAFSDIRVDRSGRLWVRRYPRPLEQTQEWWVFTPEARYVGRVDMPAAFIVEDIGDDFVAGSYIVHKAAQPESDAIMDSNTYDVRLYRLRRN